MKDVEKLVDSNGVVMQIVDGAARDMIAAEYDETASYAVGDYCIYNDHYYKCNTAIPSGGETWDATHWDATTLGAEDKEIKSSLSLQKIAENIALSTTVDTKTITSINGALEVWLLGKVNSTFRGSLALPASVFKAGYACYIPCIGENVSATIYVEYVSDTQIKCSTSNATFNYLDIYVKKQ